MTKAAAALSAVLLAGLTTPAALSQTTGVVMEFEVTTTGQPARAMTASVAGQNLKMDMPATGSERPGQVIFRGDRREMIIVNHQEKTFLVMNEASVKQLVAKLGGMMAQMEQALAKVPEAQRPMVQEMMRARGMGPASAPRPRPELRRTTERATHSGYATVKHDVVVGARPVRELWVTPWQNIEGHQEIRPAFEGMASFSKVLTDALANSPMAAMADLENNSYSLLTEMNGFPVVVRELNNTTRPDTETTLRSTTRRSLNPADFEAPAGYTRQQMAGVP